MSDPLPVVRDSSFEELIKNDGDSINASLSINEEFAEQSEIVVDPTKHQSEQDEQTNVSFLENQQVDTVSIQTNNYLSNLTDFTGIQDFFRRPVRLHTFTWNEADPVGFKVQYTVWSDWATNAYVQNKLNNYGYMRGDLKLKIQISASPFYYGLLQASYKPLPNFKTDTIVYDAALKWLIPRSQLPKIDIDPSEGDTYEITLPFLYYFNMVNIQSLTDITDLGTLRYDIYSQLASANGTVGTGITITTYGWFENIVLSGASVGYAAQSCEYREQADEYQTGVVSKPASWVANVASRLTEVPIIGPFAMATKIGASAIAGIASIFGFTNVPVISETMPYRPESYPKFASSEIGFPVEKLTLDPKNELSVDPRIIGLSTGEDEMAISHLVQRESYLCKSTWIAADVVDTIKFTTTISPVMCDSTVIAGQAKYDGVPMAFVSNLFRYWRGDIILTFKVICSKYHKGKLRISYDPNGNNLANQNLTNNTGTTNTVYTTILDIGESNKCELLIPYQQKTQFQILDPYGQVNWTTSAAPAFTRNVATDNGMLTVRVQNTLTGPTAAPSCDILVYVRAAANMEFAVPDEIDSTHRGSFFAAQSAEYREQSSQLRAAVVNEKIIAGRVNHSVDSQYMAHFGENIKSVRQILRRVCKLQTQLLGVGGIPANSFTYYESRFLKMPPSPGYNPNGLSTANKIVAVGTYGYNFVEFTPLSWVSNAFLAYRGSTNWHFNLNGTSSMCTFRAVRYNTQVAAQVALNRVDAVSLTGSQVARNATVASGAIGQALTDQRTQAGLNIQFPMQTILLFQSTDPNTGNLGVVADGSDTASCSVLVDLPYPANTATPQLLNTYIGIGTDFSLHFFLNVPSYYVYASYPTAV